MGGTKGRPKNPNSQRSLMEARKLAEQKAREEAARAEQIAKELEESKRIQAEMRAQMEAAEQEAARLAEEARLGEERRLAEMEAAASKVANEKVELEIEEEITGEDKESTDLLELMRQATQEKAPSNTAQLEEQKMAEHDHNGDFEQVEESEIIHKSEIPGKVYAGIPPKEFADMLVEGFDALVTWGAPLSYRALAFNKDELKRLNVIRQSSKLKKKVIEYSDEDLDLFARMDEFLEYKKTVPLSEKEKQSLKIPLEVMLQEKGGDIPPGWALMYAATTIAIPRFSPHAAIYMAKQFAKYQNHNQNGNQSTEPESTEESEDNSSNA